jgi:two-component system alkaline phosphatase synthesis response regulator PhoP
MPRILVVDDDKQIVRLVQSYLERAGYQVLTAQNGETALHTIRRERPDLIVLDLMLPDRDGWEITRMVRSDPTLAPLPIIMLTARVEDTDKIIGLELGADDYIAKPFTPHEVVARVRAVLRRATGAPIVSPVLQIRGLRMDVDRHIVTRDDAAIELTPTEFDLLKVMLEQRGHAFTRLELVEKGLGYSYEGLDRTIDSHIKNLRRKLEPNPSQPTYIETVYGVGYRLKAD